MTKTETSKQGRQRGRPKVGETGLDRKQVFAEALLMLEKDGLGSMTMRRLADRLKVSPMALYNHVSNKEDLLQGVAETLLDHAEFSGAGSDWRDRIKICFRELRLLCRTHPEAVRLLETLEKPPSKVFRPIEITLGAVEEIGIRGENALRAFYLLMNFTLGQASYEARGPSKGLDPRAREEFSGTGRVETQWNFDHAFEFGLKTILSGLESNATL